MKSTPNSCRICASAKWPMRALAITGIETAAMICLMSEGFAMRATPPSARIMAGTRSRAMTEVAPASSAMRACSTFITSMMTPPLSISARPTFRRRLVAVKFLFSFNSGIDFDPAPRQFPGSFGARKTARRSPYQCSSDVARRFDRAKPAEVSPERFLALPNPICSASGHLSACFVKRMATQHPLPAPANEPPHPPDPAASSAIAAEQALVPSPHPPGGGTGIALSAPVARLPVELDVAVPVREFRVRNLLTLEPGQVIETQWAHGEDLPLAAGEVQLAWSEFEVIDSQLAVRVTRLA